jgi:DNA mismatch repair protein MutS
MSIDPATRNNLELTRRLSGEARGSLLDAIDRTVHRCGGATAWPRLAQPLKDVATLQQRLDSVSFFVTGTNVCGRCPDGAAPSSRL